MKFRFALVTAGICCLSLLAGCSGMLDKVFEPDPSSIQVRLIADTGVNPNKDGRPSPLVTRFYELKSLSVFNNTDFFTLYDQDVALLGAELLARDELRFQPGEEKQITRELQPDTKFIGIIGAYRNIENATWRRSIEIEPNEKTSFEVRFNEIAIDIQKTRD